ncbi:hypothetical protein CONLIGDRAFT_685887 [Coniochaeta ligniaria NRRL 30616]|uniref:Uncharacterized protein n=1 Tax=Coniochaeta ligniaria NRRL 30616 TaxID=1408157 RepID=A0A1J7J9Q9_9PEZI|nr:hypothetical protein CONLIGDRAFT_685887 [Coniochaeta ligniaria NRRL 30616]
MLRHAFPIAIELSTFSDHGLLPTPNEKGRSIRNINKNIANPSKTESLIASHPEKSLDELVSAQIINADQKAQQQTQYLKVDQEYRGFLTSEKAAFEKSFTEKLEKDHEAALVQIKDQAHKNLCQGPSS